MRQPFVAYFETLSRRLQRLRREFLVLTGLLFASSQLFLGSGRGFLQHRQARRGRCAQVSGGGLSKRGWRVARLCRACTHIPYLDGNMNEWFFWKGREKSLQSNAPAQEICVKVRSKLRDSPPKSRQKFHKSRVRNKRQLPQFGSKHVGRRARNPIAQRLVPALPFFPHAQQGRVAGVDEIDDAYIGFARMCALQAPAILLQSAFP